MTAASGEHARPSSDDAALARLRRALDGRYAVERELGQGGMATVYLAHDVRHGRDVAIKVLHPDLGATLGSERFLSEIRTTARMQHPHVLPLLDSGEADRLLYYVMPLVTGETLRARLEREGQLPIDDVVQIARETADALHYAHSLGVVHRDVKPENILLQNGHAVVADFGIALAVQHAGGSRMTQTGLSLGTPQYMSPEQAMGERTVDFHADIYALGAVTYEMLTGEPPFAGASVQAIVAKVLTERPVPPSVVRDTVPVHVERAVLTALAKLPADRHRSAEEFRRVLGDPGSEPRAPARDAASGTPARARGRRDRIVIGGAVTAAIALTAATVWALATRGASDVADGSVMRLRLELPEVGAVSAEAPGRMVAVSPDGRLAAYTGVTAQGVAQLYVRAWDALDATPVPGSENAMEPAFSPTGDSIAFLVPPHRLKVVPLSGGVPVIVADSGIYGVTDGITGLDWGADGALYVATQAGVARVRPRERRLEAVSRFDSTRGDYAHFYPRLLPNGKGILVTIGFDARLLADSLLVGVVNLETGATTAILRGVRPQYAATGHLVYGRADGVLMAVPFDQDRLAVTGASVELRDTTMATVSRVAVADFFLSASGTLFYSRLGELTGRAHWVDRSGRSVAFRPELQGNQGGATISPDGTRAAMSIDDDIWVVPLDGAPPVRLEIRGLANEGRVAWAPDGRSLYIVALRRDRVATIFHVPVSEGVQPRDVALGDARPMFGVAMSPDGRWLLVRTDNQIAGAGDILGLRLGIDSAPRALVATRGEDLSPAVSPDGRWLAYSSNHSGRHEIYVSPFPETHLATHRVSLAGGTEPRWARSGRELFYRNAQEKLVAVPVTSGTTFTKGVPVELFDASPFAATVYSQGYDVSADGRRFLMHRIEGSQRPQPVVVFNFLDELRAIMKRGTR